MRPGGPATLQERAASLGRVSQGGDERVDVRAMTADPAVPPAAATPTRGRALPGRPDSADRAPGRRRALRAGAVVTGAALLLGIGAVPAAGATRGPLAFAVTKAAAKPPVAKPPVAKPPVAKPPVAKPPVAKPTPARPTTARPTTAKPGTTKPAAGRPATRKPATGKPAAGKPAAGKPAVGKPAVGKPAAGKPAAGKPAPATSPALPGGGLAPLHITPTGSGARDGSSWASAGDLSALPRFLAARPKGGRIWLRADAGAYRSTKTLDLRSGGAPGAPVVISGVDAAGRPARAQFVGRRVTPYRPGGSVGHQVFELQGGARHLAFRDMDFTSVGSAFVIGGESADISISDMSATNVRFFLDNLRAKKQPTASVTGLTVRRVAVAGFSKSAVRLRYDSTRILLEDVVADSLQQDRDRFAMGVALQGRASHVVLRRVTMAGSRDTTSDYWNGDGFATERGVSDVHFEDTRATGSTDGGYDLKSTRTTLVRATAEDNKRNFRFWATDTIVTGCSGSRPVSRGGTGSAAQVWLGEGAQVVMTACRFVDGTAPGTVFQLEEDSRLELRSSTVTTSPGRRLSLLEPRAQLVLPAQG